VGKNALKKEKKINRRELHGKATGPGKSSGSEGKIDQIATPLKTLKNR